MWTQDTSILVLMLRCLCFCFYTYFKYIFSYKNFYIFVCEHKTLRSWCLCLGAYASASTLILNIYFHTKNFYIFVCEHKTLRSWCLCLGAYASASTLILNIYFHTKIFIFLYVNTKHFDDLGSRILFFYIFVYNILYTYLLNNLLFFS